MKPQNGVKGVLKTNTVIWKLFAALLCAHFQGVFSETCPAPDEILPCRCSIQDKEIHIWCSHSSLPQILNSIKQLETSIKSPIDELVLENNQLPALPGRFFGSLQIVRLMLRHNNLERVSNGWLNELENSLVEIFIVEPRLRSIPVESLNNFINLIAITIQSDDLKYLPNFSGLMSLSYLNVQSRQLIEMAPQAFRQLPQLQEIHINGGPNINKLPLGTFKELISLENLDLAKNGINWIHLRGLYRLPNLKNFKLSYNDISDVAMIGRVIKSLEGLKVLRLDHNIVSLLAESSFVDLPNLSELYLNDNRITDIKYGAFYRTPNLKKVYLHNNHIKRIHPESFLQMSGTGVESLYIYHNEIERVDELKSLLDSLPTLRFLDISNNFLEVIPFGALRGHGTLEQLYLNNNNIRNIGRDAFMAMPALRELRLRNNSLTDKLPRPFWNLPGLMGLDLSFNRLTFIDAGLLIGLPSLRRMDLSENLLNKIHPDAFQSNPLLETLNISSNSLTWLHSDTFHNLNRLFEIDASVNRMTEFIPGLPNIVERVSIRNNLISSLHPSLGKLPNLRMLDLSANKIEHIPKRTFQMINELRVLSLADNKLRTLERNTFTGIERIELLNLQNNDIGEIEEQTFWGMNNLRTLNLNGNKLEYIPDNIFANNSKLEQLNLALNTIREIANRSFEQQTGLQFLDISGNHLSDLSTTMANMENLREIDLSYNNIIQLKPELIASWKSVEEIRLSNNLISEIRSGTFQNLPKLQYLDLSSNEIGVVEQGAIKNLPDLQELVLADNKIVELKHQVVQNLPNLLALHLQHNLLRFIAPDSFFDSPSIVFINLSSNNFYSMDNIGLQNLKNLEVLDLSHNTIRAISTLPLRSLNWLVELKMDSNQICKIQGYPFEIMPRLRVLSLRNNRLKTLHEKAFKNLRGNIAIFDLDGNPMICTCTVQWLGGWLEETNFPYPGPTCKDGQLLRNLRSERLNCTDDQRSSDYLPLYNDHGDLFGGERRDEFKDDCDALVMEIDNLTRPSLTESDYFYDQFVDFPAHNNSIGSISHSSPTNINVNHIPPHQNHPNLGIRDNIDLSKTLLNTSLLNRHPVAQQAQSAFTFFGYPLPPLNVGRFFGKNSRRDHGYTKTIPTKGKVRMLQQLNGTELEKYLAQKTQYPRISSRNRGSSESSLEEASITEEQNLFKTSLTEPNIQKGGFKPIIPERFGGFIPMSPTKTTFKLTIASEETSRSVPDQETPETTEGSASFEEPTTFIAPTTHTYHVTEPSSEIITERIQTQLYGISTTLSANDVEIEDLLENPTETTTMKTILLIPPADELKFPNYKQLYVTNPPVSSSEDDKLLNSMEIFTHRSAGGKSTITKVFTTPTLKRYLPIAAEYSSESATNPTLRYSTTDSPIMASSLYGNTYRKDGMDWYYNSYRTQKRLERHERLENSLYNGAHQKSTGKVLYTVWMLLFVLCLS